MNQYWTVYWRGSDALYTKGEGVIGSRWLDQEISNLLEEGRILAGEK